MDFLCPGGLKNGKNQSINLSENLPLLDKDKVLEMVRDGLTDTEIGNLFKCSRITVFRFRRENGIKTSRGGKRSDAGRKEILTVDNLEEISGYVKGGRCNTEIAGMFGCTARTVQNYREEYGIDKEIEKQLKKLLASFDLIFNPPSLAQLVLETGFAPSVIRAHVKKLGHEKILDPLSAFIDFYSTHAVQNLQWRDACVLSYERIDRHPFDPYYEGEQEKCTAIIAGDGNSRRGRGGARHNSHNSQIYASIN